MITNIKDVLSLGPNKSGKDLTVSAAVHHVLLALSTNLIFANAQLTRLLIDAPQHSSLVEK